MNGLAPGPPGGATESEEYWAAYVLGLLTGAGLGMLLMCVLTRLEAG